MDVVGGAAAAARLRDEQPDLVQVVAPDFHRGDQLADDQERGIAGVVVDILEPLVHDPPVVGGQHFDMIAV